MSIESSEFQIFQSLDALSEDLIDLQLVEIQATIVVFFWSGYFDIVVICL